MSIDRKALLAALFVAAATLSACTESELSPQTTAPAAKVPLPNVDYYLPPADTTRANTSIVPVGSALCPTVTRFGTPTANLASAGCIFR
jgi:hypothetical protein